MTENELARALFGKRDRDLGTTVVVGRALTDSENGSVYVDVGGAVSGDTIVSDPETGDVSQTDGASQGIEVPTPGGISEGDVVYVVLNGTRPVSATGEGSTDAAATAAKEAKDIAKATGQHFWHDDHGAHVTEAEQVEYAEEPSGFQNLMTSLGNIFTKAVGGVEKILRSDTASGMVIYDGECAPDAEDLEDHVVGAFTKDGAQIGLKSNAHMEMDFNSFKMVDKDGYEFFVADDLRGLDGLATMTETFRGDGSTTNFSVLFIPDEFVSVTDSSHEGATYSTSQQHVYLNVAPSDGATVTIVYKTSSSDAKAYTLGKRVAGSVAGPMSVATGIATTASGAYSHAEGHGADASGISSHAEGYNTTATDISSHAEGEGTIASGSSSHAEGYAAIASGQISHAEGQGTRAASANQHVEGKYNVADTNNQYAHIVGNGSDDNRRSNAHTVDWGGNAWYAGDVTAGGKVTATGEVKGSDCKSANYSLEDVGDSISQLTTKAATRNTSTTSGGSITYTRNGPEVIVSVTVNVTTIAKNTVVGSGLPLPTANAFMPTASSGGRSCPMYVDSATGRLILAEAAPSAGWYNGSVPYFTA